MYGQRNYGCRIQEVKIYDTQTIILENEYLRVSVLAGKGADIYELLDKRTDTDFMYRERRGLDRLDGFVPSVTTEQGAFWDYMIGGWFELFPNASNVSQIAGAAIGQHGEVYTQPWSVTVECDTEECIRVRFSVRTKRTPFLLSRTMELTKGNPVLKIKETVTNEGAVPLECLWGHHITIGDGFLNENCVVDMPKCKVTNQAAFDSPASRIKPDDPAEWYTLPGKDGGVIDGSKVLSRDAQVGEMLFATEMEKPWFAVTDPVRKVGMGVAWSGDIYKSLWIWEEFGSIASYPMFGDCYAIALEPQVSEVPMVGRAAAAGKALLVNPGETVNSWLTATVYHDDRKVSNVEETGTITFV